MFDVNAEIEVTARPASAGGVPTAISLRFPTDEEWAVRQRSRKIIIRRLGRGRSEVVAPEPSQADLTLFEKITTNGAPTLTPAEAAKVLEALATADVNSVAIEGSTATVEMETMAGKVVHTLKVPTADQVIRFRRSAFRMIELPYNQQELRQSPDAGARLYDECGGSSADYEGAIPALHKDAAVRGVIDDVDRQLAPKKDEENF